MIKQDKIAYNCKKATLLIEKRAFEKITVKESLELSFHLAGCIACKLYERQSIVINKMTGFLFNNKAKTLKLSPNEKRNIQAALEKKLDGIINT